MYDVIVVGAGIVGAAAAHELASRGKNVLVVDKERSPAAHQSGRNSNVIHSGIYYEPGSLKAQLCKRGAAATKLFALEHSIPLVECGKLLVATSEVEMERLLQIRERAGISVEMLDQSELSRKEPHVVGVGAMLVHDAAITDYAAITRTLLEQVQRAGGRVILQTEVTNICEEPGSVTIETDRGPFVAKQAVFCAGLQADRLARLAGLDVDFRIVPFRGEYFDVVSEKSGLVSTLIYPVPDPDLPFLGVHLTPTVDGRLHVGPNAVLSMAREKYAKGAFSWTDFRDSVTFPGLWHVARTHAGTGAKELRNSLWKGGYLRECQKYCPSLEIKDLIPGPAGIRAQAVRRDGTFVHDFLLHQTSRMLHVLNAPSPAATSSLPIARRLADMATQPDRPRGH